MRSSFFLLIDGSSILLKPQVLTPGSGFVPLIDCLHPRRKDACVQIVHDQGTAPGNPALEEAIRGMQAKNLSMLLRGSSHTSNDFVQGSSHEIAGTAKRDGKVVGTYEEGIDPRKGWH